MFRSSSQAPTHFSTDENLRLQLARHSAFFLARVGSSFSFVIDRKTKVNLAY
jgi:hypothetical protein